MGPNKLPFPCPTLFLCPVFTKTDAKARVWQPKSMHVLFWIPKMKPQKNEDLRSFFCDFIFECETHREKEKQSKTNPAKSSEVKEKRFRPWTCVLISWPCGTRHVTKQKIFFCNLFFRTIWHRYPQFWVLESCLVCNKGQKKKVSSCSNLRSCILSETFKDMQISVEFKFHCMPEGLALPPTHPRSLRQVPFCDKIPLTQKLKKNVKKCVKKFLFTIAFTFLLQRKRLDCSFFLVTVQLDADWVNSFGNYPLCFDFVVLSFIVFSPKKRNATHHTHNIKPLGLCLQICWILRERFVQTIFSLLKC